MPVSALLVINPVAGGGQATKILDRAVELLKAKGLQFTQQLIQYPGHAAQLAKYAVSAGYKRLIICGGDGTLNEVVNGMQGAKLELGLIPGGRGNDFAYHLGLSTDLEQACQVAVCGNIRELDVARIGERYYCSVASIGFAAEVNRLANKNSYVHKGKSAYLYALWQTLSRYKAYKLKLEYDAGTYEGEVLMVAVGNSACFGGGLRVTPKASAEDGLLDICIVELVSKLRFLSSFPAVFKGKHLRYDFVKYIRTPKLKISADTPLDVFADGEFMQQLPAEVSVYSRALNFLVP